MCCQLVSPRLFVRMFLNEQHQKHFSQPNNNNVNLIDLTWHEPSKIFLDLLHRQTHALFCIIVLMHYVECTCAIDIPTEFCGFELHFFHMHDLCMNNEQKIILKWNLFIHVIVCCCWFGHFCHLPKNAGMRVHIIVWIKF